MALVFLILLIFFLVMLSKFSPKAFVNRCLSYECKNNINGQCRNKCIEIYNNGAKGMCLWHSEDIFRRVSEAYQKGIEVGKRMGQVESLDNMIRELVDKRAIKDSNEFVEWIKRHMPKEENKGGF